MIKLREFFPYVEPHVDGCGRPVIEQAIRSAAIELCRRSHTWKEDIAIDLQRNVDDYPIDAPKCSTVLTLDMVCINGQEYTPHNPRVCCSCQVGNQLWEFSKDRTRITIRPRPVKDTEQAGVLTVSLLPGQDICELPDKLYHEWAEEIGKGALARLFLMPRKKWTDKELGVYYSKEFNKAQIRAKNAVQYGGQPGPRYLRGEVF